MVFTRPKTFFQRRQLTSSYTIKLAQMPRLRDAQALEGSIDRGMRGAYEKQATRSRRELGIGSTQFRALKPIVRVASPQWLKSAFKDG